jgi:hypothetical protein
MVSSNSPFKYTISNTNRSTGLPSKDVGITIYAHVVSLEIGWRVLLVLRCHVSYPTQELERYGVL